MRAPPLDPFRERYCLYSSMRRLTSSLLDCSSAIRFLSFSARRSSLTLLNKSCSITISSNVLRSRIVTSLTDAGFSCISLRSLSKILTASSVSPRSIFSCALIYSASSLLRNATFFACFFALHEILHHNPCVCTFRLVNALFLSIWSAAHLHRSAFTV